MVLDTLPLGMHANTSMQQMPISDAQWQSVKVCQGLQFILASIRRLVTSLERVQT